MGVAREQGKAAAAAMLFASTPAAEGLCSVLQIVTMYYNQVKASAEEDNSVWGINDPTLGYT